MSRLARACPLLLVFALGLSAQGPPPYGRRPGPPPGPPPGDSSAGMPGKWWTNPSVIRALGLTNDQQRGMEDIFQQNRLKLIDLSAALEREEAVLDPLLASDHPQEARVFAQIDRVAEARAALEKADARMLFRFRTLLSADQWRLLQSLGRGGPPPPRN